MIIIISKQLKKILKSTTKMMVIKNRSEERRVGKDVKISVDLGGRRIIKKKKTTKTTEQQELGECEKNQVANHRERILGTNRRVSFFFFKQKTAYEISECDWSSDVCSSD